MLQIFTFSGASQVIDAQGAFFMYAQSTTAPQGIDDRITVVIDGASVGVRRPGDWIELPKAARRWQIIPFDAAARGEIAIGNAKTGTGRVIGQVEIIDGSVAQVLANQHFIGMTYIDPLAANFNGGAIAASGRSIAVAKVTSSCTAATRIRMRAYTGTPTGVVSFTNARSKNLGASVANAFQFNVRDTVEDFPGATFLNVVVQQLTPTNAPSVFNFDPPLILASGEGLMVSSNTANQVLAVTFEGRIL